MIKKAKNILSLKSNEVLDFFMKSEQYHGFELPEYFDFDKVLLYVRESIGEKLYDECLTDIRPDDLPNVNRLSCNSPWMSRHTSYSNIIIRRYIYEIKCVPLRHGKDK